MDKNKSSAQPLSNLTFSDFKPETVVFEVRFAACYRLWDCSGSLWTKILDRWPTLKNVEASPVKTTFSLEDKFALTVELERAVGMGYFPRANMREFQEIIQPFVETATKELRIEDYTRVGFRQKFVREFATKEEASKALATTAILHVPKSPQFGIDGIALLPEYAVRWEGKSTGAIVRLRAEERKIELEPALGVTEVEEVRITKYRVSLDVDYYASATVTVGQLRIKDWIDQAQHLVGRDINAFLHGNR